jgi:hypothetical protein
LCDTRDDWLKIFSNDFFESLILSGLRLAPLSSWGTWYSRRPSP